MTWFVNGIEVTNEKGWTAAANRLVHKVQQWRPSREGNQGPTGWKTKPGPRFHRSMAEMAAAHRIRRHT